jgi:hypothetical protein
MGSSDLGAKLADPDQVRGMMTPGARNMMVTRMRSKRVSHITDNFFTCIGSRVTRASRFSATPVMVPLFANVLFETITETMFGRNNAFRNQVGGYTADGKGEDA